MYASYFSFHFGKPIHAITFRLHRKSSRRLMRMLVLHKPHNANHANTGRVTIGEVPDRLCKTETHLFPPALLILRSLLADQQLVTHRVPLVARSAGKLSHRPVGGQANSSSRLPRYAHASHPLEVYIPTLLRLLQARSGEVRTAMAFRE